MEAVAQAGYQVVINLGLAQAPYALQDECALIASLGLVYVHIPVEWESPRPGDLEAFFTALKTHQGKRLFIHCAANMRVSVFLALYRIVELAWPPDQALENIRPIWIPNPIWARFIRDVLISQNIQFDISTVFDPESRGD